MLPNSTPLIKTFFKLGALSVIMSVCLAEIYGLFILLWDTSDLISIAMVNTMLAMLTWILVLRKHSAPPMPVIYLLPSVLVIGTTLAVTTISRTLFPFAEFLPLNLMSLLSILWIPIIEETVFRAAIGGCLRQLGGNLWGAYFSALAFSFVHSLPTLDRLQSGHWGFFLGPFLLGLSCEALYIFSRRLLPGMCFHAACNATVIIFSLGDARWLRWLEMLYVGS